MIEGAEAATFLQEGTEAAIFCVNAKKRIKRVKRKL
jgi:hypothetical protein